MVYQTRECILLSLDLVNTMKIAIVTALWVALLALAFTASNGSGLENDNDELDLATDQGGLGPQLQPPGFDFDSDDDNDDEEDENLDGVVFDGIPLRYLTASQIEDLLDEDDNIVKSEIDIAVARFELLNSSPICAGGNCRTKRAWPLVFAAGRALFTGARALKTTRSAARVTRHYSKRGNPTNDFNRLNPSNQKSFTSGNGISGRTGTVGKHRVTSRTGSSEGRPTLEIRSPKPNGGQTVRKFRYDSD